jgi:hypothetical protein
MLSTAHGEENGSLIPVRKPAVFLTHASLPLHNAADSEILRSVFVGNLETVRYDFERFLWSLSFSERK